MKTRLGGRRSFSGEKAEEAAGIAAVDGGKATPGGTGGRSGWKSRVWLVYLLVAIVAVSAYTFIPPNETTQGAFYSLFAASALAAVFVGLWLHRPARPVLWYIFGAYQLALLVGEVIYVSYLAFSGIEFPFPSVADVFFLISYIPLICGLVLMIRRQAPGYDQRGLLDAAIIAAGAGVLTWVFFAEPYAEDSSLPPIERLTSMIFLFATLLTFAVLVRLVTTFREQVASYYLLSLSVLSLLAADMVYGAQSLTGLYRDYDLVVGAGWLMSYVLFGAAALHPTMRALGEPASGAEEKNITWWRLVLLAGALLLAPLMIVVQNVRGDYVDVEIIAGVSAALSLLVLFRMEGLVRMLKAASERYERSATREEVLRKAGASLVAAPTREDVYQAALGAVLELVGDEKIRVYVGAGTSKEVTVVAAAGVLEEVEGARLDLGRLPESLRRALVEGVCVEARGLDAADLLGSLGFEPRTGGILLSPLIHEEGFMGVLVAATDSPAFDDETRGGFEALGLQVSLALEGAILAERIHRRKDEERFGALIQNSSDVITVVDAKGFILYQSPSLERVLGYETGDRRGKNIFGPTSITHPEDAVEQRTAFVRAVARPRENATTELRRRHRDGSWLWLQEIYTSLLDDPEVGGVVINTRDVTERRRSEQRLREAHQRLGFHVENSPVGVIEWDKDLCILRWSQEAERIFGWRAEETVGKGMSDLRFIHEEDEKEVGEVVFRLLSGTERRVKFQNRNYRKDGSVVHCEWYHSALVDESGELVSVMSLALDVTGRKELEEELEHQALHDPLTGLANRTLFADRVQHALSRGDRRTRPPAIMLLDLDEFKEINDNLGHAGGDEVLREVARRLSGCLRSGDTAARLGGDEFAILVENAPDVAGFIRVAERILEALDTPFLLEEGETHIRASLGIAAGEAEETVENLLHKADVAMYAAKRRNKGGYGFFDPAMHAATLERLALKTELKKAIQRREFVVHYQPIVAVPSREIVEVEALVRWEHPAEGLIPPGKFIPIAEETGLIVPIGKLVLEEACRRVQAWRARDRSSLTLSVNLSARQFQRSNLVDDIREVLSKTGLPPGRLKLEITESVAMDDVEATLETLRKLKALGIKLAIDDFGTGYSSLAYLERFPVNTLKIDRSFVDRLGEDPESSAIVATTISLARVLNLTVTAEGVETAGHLARLDDLGCDLAQGYYFSKPIPAVSMSELLSEPILD